MTHGTHLLCRAMHKLVKGLVPVSINKNLITFETRNEITKNISWKIANMTVFDCDFLHDDIEMVAQATIVATIVDGEEVLKHKTMSSIKSNLT